MSIEATAEALATDTALPDQVALDTNSEDAELKEIYDRLNSEEEVTEEVSDEAPEKVAEEPEPEVAEEPEAEEVDEPEVEAPSDIPRGIKDNWSKIPEEARKGFIESQREMGRKLSEQGRITSAIAPIRDKLVEAAQNFPALAGMKPDQVADVAFRYAQIEQDFAAKPVETMLGLIRQHGLESAMQQAIAGQAPTEQSTETNRLLQHINKLERQLSTVADPEYLRSQFEQYSTQTSTMSEVDKFSSEAEHWSAVESDMPRFIQAVQQLSPGASSQDVLREAYDLAVSKIVPEAQRAKPDTAAEQAAQVPVDPAKAEAARKAKSVNVRNSSTGKFREMSEDEVLMDAYRRAQSK